MRRSHDSKKEDKDEAGNFRCLECGTLFTSEATIESHIQRHHNPMNVYTCVRCKRSFKDNWHLKRHVVGHQMKELSEKVFICHVCKKVFKDPVQLQRHTNSCCGAQDGSEGKETKRPVEVIDADLRDERKLLTQFETEWFEFAEKRSTFHPPDCEKRAVPPSPVVPVSDFFACRICGEVFPRDNFVSHLTAHVGDLYQVGETAALVLKTGAIRKKQKTKCGHCTPSADLIDKLKRSLVVLAQNSL